MSWRDRYRPATIDDVPFKVDAALWEGGRRTQTHVYPGRPTPSSEDLGRYPRRRTLEGFVIGPDYDLQRDALIEVFERKGPYKLVHPYMGEMTIACEGPVSGREEKDRGGQWTFTIQIVEVEPRVRQPTATPDTAQRTRDAADAANAAAKSSFDDSFEAVGHPEQVRTSATSVLQNAAQKLRETRRAISGSSGPSLADDVSRDIRALSNEASALIRSPGTLSSRMQGTIEGTFAAVTDVAEVFVGTVSDVLGLGSKKAQETSAPDIQGASPIRERQRINAEAIVELQRVTAASATARQATAVPFSSRQQADRLKDRVESDLQGLEKTASTDEVYQSLRDLRAETRRHLEQVAGTLPEVVDYRPPRTLPALVVAHNLYGDARRHREIVDRNRIENPARVPGGELLEVLSV